MTDTSRSHWEYMPPKVLFFFFSVLKYGVVVVVVVVARITVIDSAWKGF